MASQMTSSSLQMSQKRSQSIILQLVGFRLMIFYFTIFSLTNYQELEHNIYLTNLLYSNKNVFEQ